MKDKWRYHPALVREQNKYTLKVSFSNVPLLILTQNSALCDGLFDSTLFILASLSSVPLHVLS